MQHQYGISAGRRNRRAARLPAAPRRVPYIERKIGTFKILSEEGLCLIEQNADTILRDVGMEFRGDPEVLEIFKEAGADVKGERVRFEPGMCRQIVQASAPRAFIQHARNPQNTIKIGENSAVFCPGYGSPFVHDLDRGRRYATLEDFHNLVKLHQTLPALHHSGGIVCEPVDVPVNKRHLDMLLGHILYSDRGFIGGLIGTEHAADSVAMAKILFGDAFFDQNCCLYAVCNTNSPLVLHNTMSGSLKVYARNNQAVACTPVMLTGAMSPCTEAGTLAQFLAEALPICALTQLIRPGAPCLIGIFATAISMQSGAPTFGNPESGKIILAAGQLAKRLGVPFHTSGAFTSSKIPDGQAQQESTYGLTIALLSGANFIIHACGWLEGGLCIGFEKSVIDADLCGKLQAFAEGIDLSDDTQALHAISEVGPGGHFFSARHTLENYRTAFYRSPTADANTFEQWQADGSPDVIQRANQLYSKLLADYEQPPIDAAIREELEEFVAIKKASMQDRYY
jgi:trimethylamine--corrinoid protein Co-methyltransferase